LARAANNVAGSLADIFLTYSPTLPPDVILLQYLGREVILDATQYDFSGTVADIDTMETVWTRLRDPLIDRGSSQDVEHLDMLLRTLREDLETDETAKLLEDAKHLLPLLEQIEEALLPNSKKEEGRR
jgi:hypothetical protein